MIQIVLKILFIVPQIFSLKLFRINFRCESKNKRDTSQKNKRRRNKWQTDICISIRNPFISSFTTRLCFNSFFRYLHATRIIGCVRLSSRSSHQAFKTVAVANRIPFDAIFRTRESQQFRNSGEVRRGCASLVIARGSRARVL